MKLDRPKFRLALDRGELVRFDAAGGVEVACESGRLWITEEAQERDVFLDAGQSVSLRGRGVALLEAVRHARVRIEQSFTRN